MRTANNKMFEKEIMELEMAEIAAVAVRKCHMVIEDVEYNNRLVTMCKEYKESLLEYEQAIKEATGYDKLPGFANDQHQLKYEQYVAQLEFSAQSIGRLNTFVKKVSGRHFLSRRYDVSRPKECRSMIKEFEVFAKQVLIETLCLQKQSEKPSC